MPSSGGSRRVRVERGIYRQENGRYAVCVMVEQQGPPDIKEFPVHEMIGA